MNLSSFTLIFLGYFVTVAETNTPSKTGYLPVSLWPCSWAATTVPVPHGPPNSDKAGTAHCPGIHQCPGFRLRDFSILRKNQRTRPVTTSNPGLRVSPVFSSGLSHYLDRTSDPGGDMLLSSVCVGLAPQLPVTASVPQKQTERTWEPELPEPSCWPVGTGKPHLTHGREDL